MACSLTHKSLNFFDVASGRMGVPYLDSSWTEEKFVKAVKALVKIGFEVSGTFVCDGLNTHKSEVLVRFVSETCGIETELEQKVK